MCCSVFKFWIFRHFLCCESRTIWKKRSKLDLVCIAGKYFPVVMSFKKVLSLSYPLFSVSSVSVLPLSTCLTKFPPTPSRIVSSWATPCSPDTLRNMSGLPAMLLLSLVPLSQLPQPPAFISLQVFPFWLHLSLLPTRVHVGCKGNVIWTLL